MKNRLPFIFIVTTIAIDAMGIGLIMPVMPVLINELTGEGLSGAAYWGGLITFVYAVMQFTFGPTIGNLSDRFGRRPVLLVSLVVLGVDYLIMAVAGSLWLLFLARAVSGIAGATYSTANAFVADISSRSERAANFGLVGAAFGLGFILGPLLGGLLGELGSRAPFYAAAGLALLNAVFGLLVLPETLPREKRRRFAWRRANPIGALRQIGKLPVIASLMVVYFVFQIAHYVYPGVWSYFAMERYAWRPGMVGISLAVVGVSMAIVQGWLIRVILARWGEVWTVIFGLWVNIATMLAIAIVWNGWAALMLTPFMALGVVVSPALQGIMSNEVDDDAQGELQGILSSVASIGTIISPVLMTQLFFRFTGENAPFYFPGAPFLAAAALVLVALLLLLSWRRSRSAGTPDQKSV